MKFVVHTDGGARGNPGPAAVGVVIEEVANHKTITFGKRIGETTNNVAEYTGVIEALTYFVSHIPGDNDKAKEKLEILFFLDSTLVVNQLNGVFNVKDARLRELLSLVRVLEGSVGGNIQYSSIPREQNTRADALVNVALDADS